MRIGLTGGLAAGKSTVAAHFQAAGIPVIDADHIGRELLDSDDRLRAKVAAAFGLPPPQPGEAMDRRELARRAFSAPGAQKRIHALLHPAIRAKVNERLAQMEQEGVTWVVVEAALLLEAGLAEDFDALVLVEAEGGEQLARFQARTGLSRGEAEARLRLQLSYEAKLARARDSGRAVYVIPNRGSREELAAQAEECLAWLRQMKSEHD